MQPHYGFRAFKPKLELFLKLANRGCGSFLSSWKRWGNLTVTARTEMQEKWVLLTVLLCEAGSYTCSGQSSSQLHWGAGSDPRWLWREDAVSLCHLCTQTSGHPQLDTVKSLFFLHYLLSLCPLFGTSNGCSLHAAPNAVKSFQAAETLEFCMFKIFLFLSFYFSHSFYSGGATSW